MKINFINLQAQYQKYKSEVDEAIHSILDSSQYVMGNEVTKLEDNLATFTGSKNAIACSSGTDALLLVLMALGIKKDDEIITTPFTFIATAEVIAFLGAKPVFVDIDEKTFNIDVSKIEEKITNKTKAIMPVSLFGLVSDMDAINDIATKHNLKVIEDAAQSFGARYKGKKSCNLSHVACTSFFPAKPLGCYGDGGAIFTDDDELTKNIRILLNHGQTRQYVHSHIGINGRLDGIQASILNVKLKYYDDEIQKREEIATRYDNELQGVFIPQIADEYSSVYAQYCVRAKNRDEIIERCKNNNVPTAIYYPIPLHLQEVFEYLGYREGDFSVTEKVSKDIFAIPMSAFLSNEEQDVIIKAINGE